MTMTESKIMQVGVEYLSAKVRSVVESFVHLLRLQQAWPFALSTPAASAQSEIQLFDRIDRLKQHANSGTAAYRIYLRGFESFAVATGADAVIERPFRPSTLLATLDRLHSERFAKPATEASAFKTEKPLSLDADQLLTWLNSCRSAEAFELSAANGRRWWLRPALREVRGASLESPATQFQLQACATSTPPANEKSLTFDQWVFWLSRSSNGASLLEHDEQCLFVVERGALSVADSREYAKLAALLIRPVSVGRAAELARVAPAQVRRFLNANQVLGRLRAIPLNHTEPVGSISPEDIILPPAKPRAPAPSGGRNLFSRLLNRLLSGPQDVR